MEDEIKLYGLAFDCPYLDRQDDCPLKDIEQLSIKEKVNWINEMSQERKQKMIKQHINCAKSRV